MNNLTSLLYLGFALLHQRGGCSGMAEVGVHNTTTKTDDPAKRQANDFADSMRNLGIEPRAPRWQRRILPLNQLRGYCLSKDFRVENHIPTAGTTRPKQMRLTRVNQVGQSACSKYLPSHLSYLFFDYCLVCFLSTNSVALLLPAIGPQLATVSFRFIPLSSLDH